jgi:dipeptide/tripeptide permease
LEQLLNIAWLLAVAGIIVAVAARLHRRTHGPHPWHIVAVVFACVALLLFPVISATDDLHPGSDLSDDAAWRHDKRSLGVQLLAVLILISLAPLLLCRASLLRTTTLNPADIRSGHLRLDAGRAPPASF